MYSQMTIQNLNEKIEALRNQVGDSIKPELQPIHPTKSEIAKIDLMINRYKGLQSKPGIEMGEYVYYEKLIKVLEQQKKGLLNEQTPNGRRLLVENTPLSIDE